MRLDYPCVGITEPKKCQFALLSEEIDVTFELQPAAG